jgi:hypothetical protein
MDAVLVQMLTDIVQHSSYNGQDQYGKPQHSSPVARKARVQYEVTTVMNQQGQERTSTTLVYMDGTFPLSVRDKLVLPDGSAPAIQLVYAPTDPDNPGVIDHYECRL